MLLASCFALLVACTDSSDKSKTADTSAPADASRAWPGVPTLPRAHELSKDAPILQLDATGLAMDGKTIAEPADSALLDARKAKPGKPLLIAGNADLPFARVSLVTQAAAQAGFEDLGFIVETQPGRYGMIRAKTPDDAPPQPGPALYVVIDTSGYHLLIAPPKAGTPPRRPAIAVTEAEGAKTYDGAALEAKIVEFIARFPTERATLMVDPEVDLGAITLTLAAMQGSECETADDPRCHIREVVLAPLR